MNFTFLTRNLYSDCLTTTKKKRGEENTLDTPEKRVNIHEDVFLRLAMAKRDNPKDKDVPLFVNFARDLRRDA